MNRKNPEQIEIPVDGLALSATLHLPESPRPPLVMGCHGLFADAESPKQKALAGALTRAGIAFLRLDHRGCGRSGGSFRELTTFAARLRDLAAARRLMEARGDLSGAVGLFGSSMGGAVCLAQALARPVAAIAVYAAPAFAEQLFAVLKAAGDDKRLPAAFFRPENSFQLPDGPLAPGPLLVLHGGDDRVVPVSHGLEIHRRAVEPKRLVIFPGGDHPLSEPGHQALFLAEVTEFFVRHLLDKNGGSGN